MFISSFSACGHSGNEEDYSDRNGRVFEYQGEQILNSVGEDDESAYTNRTLNFVEERFELIGLVFRLAGRQEFNNTDTEYRRRLANEFSEFSDHPVVTFARRNLNIGGDDAVAFIAIHLEFRDNEFVFIDNIQSMVNRFNGAFRWTGESMDEFILLLNDFYTEANFSSFFQENIGYFEYHTARFIEEAYANVNHEWFRQHGLNPDNLRPVIWASAGYTGFGPHIYGNSQHEIIAYAITPTAPTGVDYRAVYWFIIHEYAHSITGPITNMWYTGNSDFRAWADIARLNRGYATHFIAALEYITEAYVIWYMIDNYNVPLNQLLLNQIAIGYTHMTPVFAMLMSQDPIELILGMDYVISEEEHHLDLDDGRVIIWNFVDLFGYSVSVYELSFSALAMDLGTQTGDVLIVYDSDAMFGVTSLWIDIGTGEGIEGRTADFRQYSIFPLS